MSDTSIVQTQKLEVGKRWRLVAPATEPTGWRYGLYLIKPLAQDQVLFEFDQGDDWDTYRELRIPSKDAQSDAGREIPKLPRMDVFVALLHAWRSQRSSAWDILEDTAPQSSEAGREDQPGFIDESPDEWTSDRLADEILKLDVETDWPRLRELVLTAEDFNFTPDKSAQLSPRLLELATQYRDSYDTQDAPVVWSAIRTGASMLFPNESNRLLALLEPGHSIETSLVALKMLGRVFEAQPPDRPDQHADLACEVRGIAESLLNRYAIAGSQSAAMAQLAVCTLAAMASSETMLVVQAVRRIGVSWFSQQTARELRELQNSWHARPQPVAPEVLDLLERAINEVQTI